MAFTVLSLCSLVLSFLTSFTILGDFPHVTSFRFSFPFPYMLIVVALRNPVHLPSPQLLYSSPSPLSLSLLLPAYCYSALAAGSCFLLFFILQLVTINSLVFMRSFVFFLSYSLVHLPIIPSAPPLTSLASFSWAFICLCGIFLRDILLPCAW